MKMPKLLRLVVLIVTLATSMAFADEVPPGDFDAVRIAPIESTDPMPQSLDELSFKYDPSQLSDAPKIDIDFSTLQKLSQEMNSQDYQNQLAEKVVIPLASASAEKTAMTSGLTSEELVSFVSKKTKFLQSVAKTFAFIKLKPKAINKIVFLLNDNFFKNAGVIANANTRVLNIQLGVAGGLGFSDWLMAQIKKSPFFKDLPNTAGFYFMAGAGLSFGKTVKDGKTKFFIEPIIEFRHHTRIFSPFLFAAGGLSGSYTWENRSSAEALQTATFYKVSSVSTINGGQNFGFTAAAAMVFPPGGGALAGIEGKVYRLRITPDIFPQLLRIIKGLVIRNKAAQCSAILL
ncbi:MAG TPA: hypothetical protein VGE46_02480 [Bdellovibrio sp.]